MRGTGIPTLPTVCDMLMTGPGWDGGQSERSKSKQYQKKIEESIGVGPKEQSSTNVNSYRPLSYYQQIFPTQMMSKRRSQLSPDRIT